MLIKDLRAIKIKDSRGEDTIEVSVNWCKASAPSGKSTGKHETRAYRRNIEWNIKAINSLNIPYPIKTFDDLKRVEELISYEFNLSNAKQFGANALFALESAILKALAKEQKKELWQIINPKVNKIPVPIGNAVGGGLHSHVKNHPVFQEFLLIPKKKSAKDNIKIMKYVYKSIRKLLQAKNINDEGAWEASLDEERVLQLLSRFKEQVRIGLDIAASTFYYANEYNYNDKTLLREEHIDYINELIKKYALFYIEDPMQEEDFKGFTKILQHSNHITFVLVVGDDLTATHLNRIKRALKLKAINAIILKPNQNGSLLELKQIVKFCKNHKIKTIFSHRSGETLDDALADYAVGFQADYIKCGIATRWREVKLNRLIEIEKTL